jgi:T-complex protein 1 subunit epsilon
MYNSDSIIAGGVQGVVVLAGALLEQAEKLLDMGIHPLRVAEGYEIACKLAVSKLESIASTFVFSETDIQPLVRTCMTTLSSKMCALPPPPFPTPRILHSRTSSYGLLSLLPT